MALNTPVRRIAGATLLAACVGLSGGVLTSAAWVYGVETPAPPSNPSPAPASPPAPPAAAAPGVAVPAKATGMGTTRPASEFPLGPGPEEYRQGGPKGPRNRLFATGPDPFLPDQPPGDNSTPPPPPPNPSNPSAPPSSPPGFRREFPREEFQRVRSFVAENMPALRQFVDRMPEKSMDRVRLMAAFGLRNLRDVDRASREGPEMREAMLQRVAAEDAIFADLLAADTSDPAAMEQLREKIATRLESVMERWMENRRARIEAIERTLAEERQMLERDQMNQQDAITVQTDKLIKLLESLPAAPVTQPTAP